MRYGIFSDIHSNLEALEAVLGSYENLSIDKYLCAGDIVGYAANPKECLERLKLVSATSVAGNHDWAGADSILLDTFYPRAAKAAIWTRDKLSGPERDFLKSLKLTFANDDFTMVHATLDNPAGFFYLSDIQSAASTFGLLKNSICFIGHTHVPGIFIQDKDKRIGFFSGQTLKIEEDKRYIVNVGSVGQPRDGSPAAAYCIYDTDKKTVWIKRLDYDFKSAGNKIIAAGLPAFLAERLVVGR